MYNPVTLTNPGQMGGQAADKLNSIPEQKNGLSVVLIYTTLWPEL